MTTTQWHIFAGGSTLSLLVRDQSPKHTSAIKTSCFEATGLDWRSDYELSEGVGGAEFW